MYFLLDCWYLWPAYQSINTWVVKIAVSACRPFFKQKITYVSIFKHVYQYEIKVVINVFTFMLKPLNTISVLKCWRVFLHRSRRVSSPKILSYCRPSIKERSQKSQHKLANTWNCLKLLIRFPKQPKP